MANFDSKMDFFHCYNSVVGVADPAAVVVVAVVERVVLRLVVAVVAAVEAAMEAEEPLQKVGKPQTDYETGY